MPPAKDAFRGASLYSGIFDTHDASVDSKSSEPSCPSTSSFTQPEPSTSAQPAAASDTSKSSGWSAALRFAPRRTKAKARPNAAFVASFAPPPPPPPPTATDPCTEASRADALPSKPIVEAQAAASAQPEPTKSLSAAAVAADLNLTALSLPATHADDQALLVELGKHRVLEAPCTTLPESQVEREKQLIRRSRQFWNQEEEFHDENDDDQDQDVNGFLATSAGKRANKRRKKRKRVGNPPSLMTAANMNADYDPGVPNDYMAYKHTVYERRRAELDYRKWREEEEGEGGWDEDQDEMEPDEERWGRYASPPRPPPGLKEEVSVKQPESGEEAYARRVAMTAAAAASSSAEEAYQRRLALSQPRAGPPPPGPPPPHRSAPEAARAIAARLTVVQPAVQPAPAPASLGVGADSSTFAQRLMRSQGYTPGSGLGAHGNKGITSPLTAIQSSTNKARGAIVDLNAQETNLGASSPVVVLLNLAQKATLHCQTERQELVREVESECEKFGFVEKVTTHIHHPQEEGEEGEVRVFVKFTGHAGAWKAVRALQGRWFEGRQVDAFFYPEKRFKDGFLGDRLER